MDYIASDLTLYLTSKAGVLCNEVCQSFRYYFKLRFNVVIFLIIYTTANMNIVRELGAQ